MSFELIQNPDDTNVDTEVFGSGSKSQLKPFGASGSELFAGYFSEEYLQLIRGRRGAKIYDEIRRSEPQVAMLLNAIMNPIKAGVWEFEAPKDVADADTHKEFIEFCAKDCIDWETFIHEALTNLIYGYSIFEVINNIIYDHPKFGTVNALKALAFRSQKTIERWNINREIGELESVTQYIQGDLVPEQNFSQLVEIPAEFLLIFSLQKEGDNYEGISALRPMYGPWFRKNLYLKIAGIGVEKNAIGTPIGTIPAGKQTEDQVSAFKEMLENFTAHESSFITKPAGWEIEIIKNDFDASKIKDLILMENTEMINSLVANFLALGTSGGGGSYSLGSDLSDFFLTGIQNYANIICGVWNRKLIPNLIKLNFGEQTSYPKLKATGINDKAGKELAEVLTALLGNNAVKADDKLEEYLRKVYSLPKADPLTARENPKSIAAAARVPPGESIPTQLLSETRIVLAEGYKSQWNSNKAMVKSLMQDGLKAIKDDLNKQITSQYKGATARQKLSIGLNITPKTSVYEKSLREGLAKVATDALKAAKKLTPKANKSVKLSETMRLDDQVGGYFDGLPSNIQAIVRAQAGTIAQTQSADINKIVMFQYGSSQSSTDNIDQIITDINNVVDPTIDGATGQGMSIDAASGNSVSSTFNQAQLNWFFEPEVLATLESFTFTNEDPVSEICQQLDGTTWAANDPDLDRYSPPLHHNCKSRLVPNEKGDNNNPDIEKTPAINQKGLDSITLCEHDYHIKFNV